MQEPESQYQGYRGARARDGGGGSRRSGPVSGPHPEHRTHQAPNTPEFDISNSTNKGKAPLQRGTMVPAQAGTRPVGTRCLQPGRRERESSTGGLLLAPCAEVLQERAELARTCPFGRQLWVWTNILPTVC